MGIVILAGIPSLIVFSERWIGDTTVSDLLLALWCRIPRACFGPWPPSMLLIIPAILAAVFLVARRPANGDLLELARADAQESVPRLSRRQQQLAVAGVGLAALAMAAIALSAAITRIRPGWDYALAYLAFIAAAVLHEAPLHRLAPVLGAWLQAAALPLTAHLLLIVSLYAFVQRTPAAPWLAALTVSAHAYLWRTRRHTLTPAFWLISLSLVLSCLYFSAWWFSAIGDEYAFYEAAAGILERADFAAIGREIYDPARVYSTHPGFSSLIQAAGMAAFGPGLFGWRFSSIYLAALSLWPFTSFAHAIGGRRLALFAGPLLAASQYLMGFGKIGYNNLQALFAYSLCLAAAAWLIRSRERIAAAAFGAALGLCFFVYPGALLAAPVALWVVARHDPLKRASVSRWATAGVFLLATALPILIQPRFWETKPAGTFVQDSAAARNWPSASTHILSNLGQASLSFLLAPEETHFVAVGYVDVVTAGLVIIGFGALVAQRRSRTAGTLLAGLAFLLLLVGSLHGYPSPPTTRMFLLLPWLAILAGLGWLWLKNSLRAQGASEGAVRRMEAVLLALVFLANVLQAYPLARLRMAERYQSPQVLLLREAGNLLPPGPNRARLLILAMPESPLRASLARQLRLHQVPFDESSLTEASALAVSDRALGDPRTMILMAPQVPAARQAELQAALTAAGKDPCRFRNSIGEVRLVVWVAPAERYRCAGAAYRW